jgi:DNA repair exonuclease SbcCD ATPase subunit
MHDAARERLKQLKDGIHKLSTYRDILQSQVNGLEREETALAYRAELHQKASEVFKTWLEDSMKKNVDSMAELATTGLQHIIHDQKLNFQIKQEPKYNRLAMRFVLEDNGVEGDPIQSYGGGAAVVISFVLRIAVMARMKMANLLILDESMLALSNSYVPGAGAFMRRLSEETGINILMVTHNPEFLNQAHIAYDGRKEGTGTGALKLRRLRFQPAEMSP